MLLLCMFIKFLNFYCVRGFVMNGEKGGAWSLTPCDDFAGRWSGLISTPNDSWTVNPFTAMDNVKLTRQTSGRFTDLHGYVDPHLSPESYCRGCWWSWLLLYSAVLRSRADSLRSHVILHEWLAFYSSFLNIHRSGVLTALAWLVPHETADVSAQVLCTPYNHAPCHFMQSHIRKVYVCLAVTCHLHVWQNDRDL